MDKIRDIQRENLALKKRLQEVEYVLSDTKDDKASDLMTIEMLKTELKKVTLKLAETEEKCSRLQADNQDYVKQLIDMKEQMGQTLNDLLSGGAQNSKITAAADKAKSLELNIKPEYLKQQPVASHIKIDIPSSISWKTCAHKLETTCCAFNRDGNVLYSGGADGIVKGWRISDGKETGQMTGLQKAVTSVATSLDNEHVLAASLDSNKIVMYRTATNSKLLQYTGHTDNINACAFNFGKKQIISCSDDRTVRCWDQTTGKQVSLNSCPN